MEEKSRCARPLGPAPGTAGSASKRHSVGPGIQMSRRQMLVGSSAALAGTRAARLTAAGDAAQPRKVAITIDDGPVVGRGTRLDDFLRVSAALRESFVAEQVPVIMFINERQLNVDGQRDARVAVLHQWLDAGFELGNHTYSHRRLGRVPLEEFLDDIIKGEVISRPLLETRGKKLVWFRYPFLASGDGQTARDVEDFLNRRGYKIAPVSVDYHDYRFNGTYTRYVRAGQQQQAERHFETLLTALDHAFASSEQRSLATLEYELPQTLLIHCNEMNSITLRTSIERIRERGYEFVSLDEAMEDPAYNLPGIRPGGLGGGGLFTSLAAARRAVLSPP